MTPEAFEDLVRPFRRELAAHCYRILGSLQDAEDQVQETLISAWRGIDGFEGRASVRSWLYKIATNRCLDEIRRRPRHGLPSSHGAPYDPRAPWQPLGEMLWIDPAPAELAEGTPNPEALYTQRESVQLAFIVALQQLPAVQRATLILRDVLGWSAADVAELLDTSVAAVNSALQRARATVDARPRADAADVGPLVERYVAAWEQRDLDALVSLLHDDVTFSMPPQPAWFRGAEDVGAFFRTRLDEPVQRRVVRVPGADEVVLAFYRGTASPLTCYAIHVVGFEGGWVTQIHHFMGPVVAKFGVAQTLTIDR